MSQVSSAEKFCRGCAKRPLRGMCLGFEIPDDLNITKIVKYVSEKLPFPETPTFDDAQAMLFTKYSNWQYESEVRIWAELNDEEDGLYYCDFDDSLRLVEVIAGARCTVPRNAITRALGSLARCVNLTKARAGFSRFEVVIDQRGLV